MDDNKESNEKREDSTRTVHVEAPGFVFIKNALDETQQLFWANYALEVGNDPSQGFWVTNTSASGEVTRDPNLGSRGRVYDAVHCYRDSDQVAALCHSMISLARENDPAIPQMNPTHLIMLYYATAQGLYWHADDDVNDGDNDHPIVSLSLGNSCKFGYRINGQVKHIMLHSGDVLVWGGPLRMMQHAVLQVNSNTCPEYLPIKNARINFTFRDSPNMLGHEEEWKTGHILGEEAKYAKSQASSSNNTKVKEADNSKNSANTNNNNTNNNNTNNNTNTNTDNNNTDNNNNNNNNSSNQDGNCVIS